MAFLWYIPYRTRRSTCTVFKILLPNPRLGNKSIGLNNFQCPNCGPVKNYLRSTKSHSIKDIGRD